MAECEPSRARRLLPDPGPCPTPRGGPPCFRRSPGCAGQAALGAHGIAVAVPCRRGGRGLTVAGFTTQREFLLNLGLGRLVESLAGMGLSQGERDANRMGMLELARPGGMGDYRVMGQTRGLEDAVELMGFSQASQLRNGSPVERGLPPAPLLSSRHLDLMAGRYPHLAWEWEGMWPGTELGLGRPHLASLSYEESVPPSSRISGNRPCFVMGGCRFHYSTPSEHW